MKRNFSCTTMIVGKNASADGTVIVAHSDDDVSDARVILVPRRQDKARNVYYDNASLGSNTTYNSTDIRRYIGPDRGPSYDTHDYPNSVPIGQIDGCSGTFTYFDFEYGIINECGLMIGECTCGAKVQPDPAPTRLFYSSELSRVALERCKTARQAIALMGELIAKYGIYATGETLLVGDANEGWVFEMCATRADLDGAGVWVAQRVPDNGFFVAANEFRIRDIYRNSGDHGDPPPGVYFYRSNDPGNEILYSANLFRYCAEQKWIEEGATRLDWLPTVSFGEYGHPYYSLRRVWRALSLVAPTLHLPTKVADGYTRTYPFSVVPEKKLSVADVAAIFRDSYEGTEFDLTCGAGAGPFRTPVRYDVNPDKGNTWNLNEYRPEGAWERPISIYRCAAFWINQAGAGNPGICWLGLDRPAANCLIPLYCGLQKLPPALETMNLLEFQFGGPSAWWAFNFVANYLNLSYDNMMKDLQNVRGPLESDAYAQVAKLLQTHDLAALSSFCLQNADNVVRQWWALATLLIVRYDDGCITTGPNSIMAKIDYPRTWLKLAGFFDGPVKY